MIYISSELSHHGVKGMKWGVRHDRKTIKLMEEPRLEKNFVR